MTLEMLLIVLTLLTLGVLIAGVVLLWRGRSQLFQLNTHWQQQIAGAGETLERAVQQSLQSGRTEQREVLQQSVQALESKFTELRTQVDLKLQQTFEANRRDLSSVTDRLVKLHDATGQIISLSKGVNELHSMLQTPKLRGSFGEWALESMLQEVLGEEGHVFRRQYRLSNEAQVDAAIFTQPAGRQVVCVDSKFPMQQAQLLLGDKLSEPQRINARRQFRKDVLAQARAIADKYILPPQTLGFAFLYVPAESIFQLILQETELHQQLIQMHVIPTSPNSFYAYLQSMAFALSGLKIQENALEIQRQVGLVASDFERFAKRYEQLGSHLQRAVNKYDQSVHDMQRFQQRLTQVQGLRKEDSAPGKPGLRRAPERDSDALLGVED